MYNNLIYVNLKSNWNSKLTLPKKEYQKKFININLYLQLKLKFECKKSCYNNVVANEYIMTIFEKIIKIVDIPKNIS